MEYRSHRGKAPKVFIVAGLNGSGSPQLLKATQHLQGRRFSGSLATVLLSQEHHYLAAAMVDAEFQFKKRGWDLRVAAATCPTGTLGANSAGVATLVRSHVQSGAPWGAGHDISPSDSQGRLSCTWLDGGIRGGILLISIYLFRTEGWTTRNLNILFAAGSVIKKWGGAWLMGGDLNMSPEQFAEGGSQWLHKVCGVIHAPKDPTCLGPSGGSVLGFYNVDGRISNGVLDTWVDGSFAGSPHSLTLISFRATASRDLHRTAYKPKRFPPRYPLDAHARRRATIRWTI